MIKSKNLSISSVFELGKDSYRGLVDDIKATKWLRGLRWFIGVIWVNSLIVSLIVVSSMPFSSPHGACQPDGSFRLHPETFSLWSSSGYFQITLGWGHLTYTQVKAIDITWDLVIGRGGQFLLALVSWKVFGKYLTTYMETQPITYQAFRTIFLQNEASIPSTYGIIRGFIWHRRLRSKIAMTFIIVTMVFILAFPTLASAMTGYDSNVSSFLPDYNGSYIPFNNFSRVLYVIHDGWRLREFALDKAALEGWFDEKDVDAAGLTTTETSEVRVFNHPYNQFSDPLSYQETCGSYRESCLREECSVVEDRCWFETQVSNYVWKYGVGGTMNSSSIFELTSTGSSNITLPPPVLNISAHIDPEDTILGGPNNIDLLQPPSWFCENQIYDNTYVQENGSCQNTGNYQWGFSFLQLVACQLLLILWTFGIYTMWLREYFTLKRTRDLSLTSGEHKAILELADAMQEELGIHHMNPSLLVEKELNDRVNNELKGGSISYYPANRERKACDITIEVTEWLKRERRWLFAFLMFSILSSTFAVPRGVSKGIRPLFWTFAIPGGIGLAMWVGTTNRVRVLILLCCTLGALTINLCVIFGDT